MNYRERKKKTPADKKLRKLASFRKKYPDTAAEMLSDCLDREQLSDRQIDRYREHTPLLPAAGEELYMTGWVGAAGTMFLANWKKEELCTRFPASFVRTAFDREVFDNFSSETDTLSAEEMIREGASWIAPVGEGGLLKTLYRFGKETGLGFRVRAGEVPVRQITIEFCEYFLLHPWELLTGESWLFTAAHDSPLFIELEKRGMSFRRIGIVTKEKQKLICRGEEESNINRPEPDGILTLLLEEQSV